MIQTGLFDTRRGAVEEALLATLRAIAARLPLERPLVVFDIEATGPLPEHDRIIELSLGRVRPDGRATFHEWLINPGVPIPAESSAVHHILDADVANAPRFEAVAADIAATFDGCDVAGFNLKRYDIRILAAEFARCGLASPLSDTTRVIDAYRIFVQNEPRDLAAAVAFYCPDSGGFNAHRAGADVEATARVLLAQLARYPGLPGDVAGLHAYCDPRDPSWIDEQGKIVWRDGEARIGFGKHAGRALRELSRNEPGLLQWILARDFPADVKQIVADALDGRFPEGPHPIPNPQSLIPNP